MEANRTAGVRRTGEAGALGGVRMKCRMNDEARAMKEEGGCGMRC